MGLTRTDSLKKAQDKYIKVSTRCYTIRFNRVKDADVIEMLERTANKQAYLRSLIRSDIDSKGGDIKEAAMKYNNDRTVTVGYDKKNGRWQATCKAAKLNIKSDSYDVLLSRIKEALPEGFTIKTKDIEYP